MFDSDIVPFFPLKLASDGAHWLVHNPVLDIDYELNESAHYVLRMCDGYRTWGEITGELARSFRTKRSALAEQSGPLLQLLTQDGILWWRQQRLQWWPLPAPFAVLWNLTGQCNLACRHCVVSGGTLGLGKDDLSLDECFNLIDELADFGVKQLILSGGEPLMRRDFLKIARYAITHRMSLQIATNGTLVTERMACQFGELGVSTQISLDGATSEVHNEFRNRPRAWERTIKAIKYLVANDVPTVVAATVTKYNANQICAIYELAADLNVDAFRILPFVPYGRGRLERDMEVSSQTMRQITHELVQRREEGDLEIVPMEFECTFAPPPVGHVTNQARIGCDGAVSYCTITSNGEVLPCSFFEGVEAENVREHSFRWIWNNSRFLNYFRSLTVGDIHGRCQECPWLSRCRGSCVATNFSHGDIFQSNYHCWLVNSDGSHPEFRVNQK